MSKTPTPQPSGAQTTEFGGINLTVPTSTSTGGDLYGVGNWGSQKVDPGSLPFPIAQSGKQVTADDVVKAFAQQNDPGTIATIQRALYLGGYYSKDYTPTFGVMRPEDVKAFGDATILAGQGGKPVTDILLGGAQTGTLAGIAAARASSGGGAKSVATVDLPNTTDLEALALKSYQQELGRKATPEEAAAFAAVYRSMSAGIQRAGNQNVYNAQVDAKSGASSATAASPASDGLTLGNTAQITDGAGGFTNAGVDMGLGHQGGMNEQLVAPDFMHQMQSLGQVAASASASANPAQGLTQVTRESPISPDVAAANYARNQNPNEAGANDVANTFNTFLQILHGNFG